MSEDSELTITQETINSIIGATVGIILVVILCKYVCGKMRKERYTQPPRGALIFAHRHIINPRRMQRRARNHHNPIPEISHRQNHSNAESIQESPNLIPPVAVKYEVGPTDHTVVTAVVVQE